MYRRLRIPGGRAVPFFPRTTLASGPRSRHTTSPTPTATRRQAARRCRSGPNGIIHIPSPPYVARSQPIWPVLYPDVPAACAHTYNTVVLGSSNAKELTNLDVTIGTLYLVHKIIGPQLGE